MASISGLSSRKAEMSARAAEATWVEAEGGRCLMSEACAGEPRGEGSKGL